jgi:hypothetical protein
MRNRMEELKKNVPAESLDKKMVKDNARADDDGFANVQNNVGTQPSDQDLDCWGDLWQRIKTKGFHFLQ